MRGNPIKASNLMGKASDFINHAQMTSKLRAIEQSPSQIQHTVQEPFRLTMRKWANPNGRRSPVKKILTLATAGILSLGIIGSALQPAEAGKRERRIAAGVALGILGTAIIVNEHKKRKKERRAARHRSYNNNYYAPRHRYNNFDYRPIRRNHVERRVFREPVRSYHSGRQLRITQAHLNWCYDRYRSYREWDNTFQPYHGPRRACYSPYN